MAIQVRDGLGEQGIAAVFGLVSEKPMVVVAVGKAAQNAGVKAGSLVRAASQVLGGGGGGKDDIAQGGGQDKALLPAAFDAIRAAI
jgi:alanyl-tRNA synthetase